MIISHNNMYVYVILPWIVSIHAWPMTLFQSALENKCKYSQMVRTIMCYFMFFYRPGEILVHLDYPSIYIAADNVDIVKAISVLARSRFNGLPPANSSEEVSATFSCLCSILSNRYWD